VTLTASPFEVDLDALNQLPPGEREEERARVEQLVAMAEANPQFRWVPHEGERGWKVQHGLPLSGEESRGQVEFLEAPQPVVAAVAGNRFGKTEVGAEFCLIQMLPEEFLPPWLLPYRWERFAGREIFVRAIGTDLGKWLKKAMLPKLRKLIPPAALWKGSFDKAWQDREQKLQFANGSWMDFLTHDMALGAFASADLDIAWFDEEPPGELGRQQWEETGQRLIDRNGVERWTLTPLLGLSFVYHELTDGFGNPRCDDDVKVVTGDIDHNPHISEEGRRRALKKFEKEPLKLEARKSGRWVHFAGMIYPEWSEKRHVAPTRAIPRQTAESLPMVPVFEAIDPGINDEHKAAYVAAWLGFDDVLEVFHSIALAGQTVDDVAAHILDVRAALGFRPRWTVIDPAAKNRHHATGRTLQFEYGRHGIYTIPGQNSRELGFNAVRQRLRTDRLVVQSHCDTLIQFFGEYRWKAPRGQQIDKPRAEPIKRNDDELDALRYLVVQLPKPPEERQDEETLDGPTRAFRQHLRRLRTGKRQGRVGGAIPVTGRRTR
jgi:hypothetical protein